jgi:hypothetical protein
MCLFCVYVLLYIGSCLAKSLSVVQGVLLSAYKNYYRTEEEARAQQLLYSHWIKKRNTYRKDKHWFLRQYIIRVELEYRLTVSDVFQFYERPIVLLTHSLRDSSKQSFWRRPVSFLAFVIKKLNLKHFTPILYVHTSPNLWPLKAWEFLWGQSLTEAAENSIH